MNSEQKKVFEAAKHGALDQIPRELLTTENLTMKKDNGWTPLHFAALHNHLTQIPRELLTQENLTIKNNSGYTPLHYAARKGHLNQIPKELLTQENLTMKDRKGWTSLHEAAWYGHLDQIPKELLTQENLTIKNNNGDTPLYWAAENGHLDQIPEEFRPAVKNIGQISDLTSGTMTNLLRKVPNKESLEILIQCSNNQRDKDFFQKGIDALKKMEASRQKLSDAITEISNQQIS